MAGLPDASAWSLDPDLAYLNHGGFGAAPTVVLADQQAWRDAMEANPAGFLTRRLPGLLDAVRERVARFIGADPAGLVFTENATTGTQTVIAQAGLRPGDEVLTTDHCYPAVLVQLRRAVEQAGAELRVVPVLVDGTHAAGMLPVDLGRIDTDFWVGNLHKWVCAPKSAAVLHAAPPWRDALRPLVASHGAFGGYQPSFDWTGTRDPSALLAVPAALAFFEQAGWQATRRHNDDLARRGAALVADRIGTSGPDSGDGMAGAMRLVRLPGGLEPADEQGARALEDRLLEQHRIVVPVTCLGGWRWLRLSAQLYNTLADYERLADALAGMGR